MKSFIVGRDCWYNQKHNEECKSYITIGDFDRDLLCTFEVSMNFSPENLYYYYFNVHGDALEFFDCCRDFTDKLKEQQRDRKGIPYKEVVEILTSLEYRNLTQKEKPKNLKI